MAVKNLNSREALRFGWNATKAQLGFLIGIAVIYTLVMVVLGWADYKIEGMLGFLAMIIYFLGSFILSLGVTKISLKIVDGQKAEFADLWNSWDVLGQYILVSVLLSLMLLVGFALFVVPGVYVLLRFFYAPVFVLDKKVKAMDAFKMSSEMTQGIKLNLFGFSIVCGLIILLGGAALIVGIFVALPVVWIAAASTYRLLQKQMDGQGALPAAATPQVQD